LYRSVSDIRDMTEIDEDTLRRLAELARSPDIPIAERSTDDIARALGITRMTLYRRAGSRRNIVERLAELGIDATGEPLVRERVIEATGALLRERPLAEVTLEAIAERARCSLPAIYGQFGGRQGVLMATFERHSPLPVVERLVASGELDAGADLREEVRALYVAIFDQVAPRWPVLRAFVAEVLRDPESEVGALFREWYLPRALETIMPTLRRHLDRGAFRPLPPLLIAQEFIGPMLLHLASRAIMRDSFGIEPPARDTSIDALTDMFCRAVAAEPAPAASFNTETENEHA
jgi:AcrR family transcriptional regulator